MRRLPSPSCSGSTAAWCRSSPRPPKGGTKTRSISSFRTSLPTTSEFAASSRLVYVFEKYFIHITCLLGKILPLFSWFLSKLWRGSFAFKPEKKLTNSIQEIDRKLEDYKPGAMVVVTGVKRNQADGGLLVQIFSVESFVPDEVGAGSYQLVQSLLFKFPGSSLHPQIGTFCSSHHQGESGSPVRISYRSCSCQKLK